MAVEVAVVVVVVVVVVAVDDVAVVLAPIEAPSRAISPETALAVAVPGLRSLPELPAHVQNALLLTATGTRRCLRPSSLPPRRAWVSNGVTKK